MTGHSVPSAVRAGCKADARRRQGRRSAAERGCYVGLLLATALITSGAVIPSTSRGLQPARKDRSLTVAARMEDRSLTVAARMEDRPLTVAARMEDRSLTVAARNETDERSASSLYRLLTLQDYNTRVVILGTGTLGAACGLIGTFLLLRKRALMADALSHATLPGIAAAFMLAVALGGDGKSLRWLLVGATVTGVMGMLVVLLIRRHSRLKEDAALGIVLSVFFGGGVVLLGIIQQMATGYAAGLETFIYGKTASMLARDAQLIAAAAVVIAVACGLLFKEFELLCFDQEFAASQGLPVLLLDVVMLGLVVGVTVIGLQAVGLILMVGLLILPPAAARFWTDRLSLLMMIAGLIGALSGVFGAAASALVPRLPAGAIIVLTGGVFFLISLVAGAQRGLLVRLADHWRLARSTALQHLLRAMYESAEAVGGGDARVGQAVGADRDTLLVMRSWGTRSLKKLIRRAIRRQLVQSDHRGRYRLTEMGRLEAERIVRNHRLWELYLVTYADVAPGQVDRDADRVEHVLGPEIVARLEALLEAGAKPPSSVHPAGVVSESHP